ncbi:hypothetical protein HID58_072353 [Brassica napus]|uniref:MATH domain-containing protein n=1 Tax=Brassica napus TaxID=3708 RepID=A0ABQ7Z487_BRANA|nr:hypothetical protein HID58_072353 [Brassica napus]
MLRFKRCYVRMGSSPTEVSTIVKNWREHPPASYSLKIHSFSQLENSTASSDDKYQSRLFSSGGYNCENLLFDTDCIPQRKLISMDDGSGFISMYVEIDSKKKKNKVLYCSSVSMHLKRCGVVAKRNFVAKTVWGLGQVLSYDTFNSSGNGYIFEGDQCEFGVNVIVSPPPTNWEILSFDDKIPHPKYLWTVEKFSELKFLIPSIYGLSRSSPDSHAPKADEKIFMQGHVRLLDPLGSNHYWARQLYDWHIESNTGWGWDQTSVVTQRQCQWLVPAGKGRPMQGRAEFLSRPGGGGLWNSARTNGFKLSRSFYDCEELERASSCFLFSQDS